MSFDGPLLSLPEAHGQPHGPPKVHGPRGHLPPGPPSRWPCSPVHIGVRCTFTDPVQVFLVLLHAVPGRLAVLYVPVAGYRYHTRLTLTVK